MPWRLGAYELPPTSIRGLLVLARLRPSDVFADLGSGTGAVVIETAKASPVKKAIGVEIERSSREKARLDAIKALTQDQLKRTDFWFGDIYSDDFDYSDVTVVYNSFEEDEEDLPFYREKFSRRLKVVKKDFPLVGYKPNSAFRKGPAWLFTTEFPPVRVKSKSQWAGMVLGRAEASIRDLYDYYHDVLARRGITRKETALALNGLERLVISRF